MSAERRTVVEMLAAGVTRLRRDRPTCVAIDGPDAAGKTMLADELARVIQSRRRTVERVSIDGFLRPRSERRADAGGHAESYYREAFDTEAFVRMILDPLRSTQFEIRAATYDYHTDTRTIGPAREVDPTAVVLVDGVFLQRPELSGRWDGVVYVDVSEDETVRRARLRDAEFFGGAEATEARYRERYLPAQALYRREVDPRTRADAVIDNDDPDHPVLVRCDLG
jgi:uridine kinase